MESNGHNPLTDTCAMPFGKYEGQAMADIPANYLLFINDKYRVAWDNGKINKASDTGRVMEYIDDNLQVLHKENKTK